MAHDHVYGICEAKCLVEVKSKEAIDSELSGKQDTITAVSVTLTVDDWDSTELTQTVSASNVTADNIVWVSPAAASFDAYGKAGIRATAQADGTITFTCTTVPADDIAVEVVA